MSDESVDATFFVSIEPEWSTWVNSDGERKLRGAKGGRLTQKRPGRTPPNAVLVKLTVRMPSAAFLPLRPEAVVVVPASYIHTAIEVEAGDTQDDE